MAIRSLQTFSRPEKIYVITASRNFEYFGMLKGKGPPLVMIDEDKLIEGIDIGTLREYFTRRGADPARAGWYFQQFLKMSMCHLPEVSNHYLIWDSDTIMLQPLSFFNPDGTPLMNPADRYHQPYFDTIRKLLLIDRLVDFSFISEHLMVRKEYMQQLIDVISQKGGTGSWPMTILDLVEDEHLSAMGFSEFEIYGNFVQRRYPGSYAIRKLRSLRSGAKRTGPVPGPKDLYLFSRKYDYVSFEVWTRPLKWKFLSWKVETVFRYAVASLTGLFSRRVAGRLKMISNMLE
ncbi:MAG: DUF6492 family protein [bacterium]|nr:DUF6492 family protein [bacterium]MDT8365286.1 DUF6492 family protein [bacterium]